MRLLSRRASLVGTSSRCVRARELEPGAPCARWGISRRHGFDDADCRRGEGRDDKAVHAFSCVANFAVGDGKYSCPMVQWTKFTAYVARGPSWLCARCILIARDGCCCLFVCCGGCHRCRYGCAIIASDMPPRRRFDASGGFEIVLRFCAAPPPASPRFLLQARVRRARAPACVQPWDAVLACARARARSSGMHRRCAMGRRYSRAGWRGRRRTRPASTRSVCP